MNGEELSERAMVEEAEADEEEEAAMATSGRRRLIVAMKLNTSCREMLTWTIAKLAQPGDHILALHVATAAEATAEDEASHAQQLASTLRGVISVYESLCNLKQIKLQLEIVSGYKVRDVLVDVASSYEACKLILGTNKTFSVGRTKALGRYCLNRLPCTCTVVILEQGEIIFNKKGRLGAEMTRLDMIKVFRRSMRIGRSKKSKPEEQGNHNKKTFHKSFSDVPVSTDTMSFGSCSPALQEDYISNSPVSVLPQEPRRNSTSGFEALRVSFSKRRAKARLAVEVDSRSDMFLLDDHSSSSPSFEDAQDYDTAYVPGWPLLNNTIAFAKQQQHGAPKSLAAIVKWVLELPKEEAEVKKTRALDLDLSLAQEVEILCLDRDCAAFAYEVLEAATSGFSQENVVGRGGGSEVFKGTMSDGKLVAVKRLKQSPQAEEELLIDIEINTSLSHTHIVSLLGYCVERSHMLLVYEYLPQGNLEDHLHSPGKEAGVLAWEVRYKVAVGVARALEYLHMGCGAKPVVHRDVKTSNILLTAEFEPQLSDFGLAKWAPTKALHLLCNDVVGTFGYLAPEYFMYGRVNDRTDVFAFGVVLLELITGRKPIDTTRPKGEENLVNWARPLLVERALDRLVDPLLRAYDVAQMNNMLIAAFLSIQQSAQRRPQMSQILRVLSGDHESTCLRPEEQTPTWDAEEVDTTYGRSDETSNILTGHLALAMMGVDDDSNSQCSVVDLPHSNKYLEDYLEGRFSRSTSFEDQS